MDADYYEAVADIGHCYSNGRITENDAVQQFRHLLREYRDETPRESHTETGENHG